ncbi:MAG: hypothetical protein AAGL11_07410 [Pseudomonadota bacterium]
MSSSVPFDFSGKLKEGEDLLWTGRGSGRNLNRHLVLPVLGVGFLGVFLLLGFPLSGFRAEMALVAVWAAIVTGIVIWFFRARILAPPLEEYAITSERILIVSGPIGRICRPYFPTQKKRTDRRAYMFYAVKHVAKRNAIHFLPARSKSMPQGFPPIFVGVEDSLKIAELAAETFQVKLIKR